MDPPKAKTIGQPLVDWGDLTGEIDVRDLAPGGVSRQVSNVSASSSTSGARRRCELVRTPDGGLMHRPIPDAWAAIPSCSNGSEYDEYVYSTAAFDRAGGDPAVLRLFLAGDEAVVTSCQDCCFPCPIMCCTQLMITAASRDDSRLAAFRYEEQTGNLYQEGVCGPQRLTATWGRYEAGAELQSSCFCFWNDPHAAWDVAPDGKLRARQNPALAVG